MGPGALEPNVHIFNQNPTKGYSEDYNSQQEVRDRYAFAAEVERAHLEDQQKRQAVNNVISGGGGYGQSNIGSNMMGGLGSGDLRNNYQY